MDNNAARLELFRQAINTQADAEAAEIVRETDEKCEALSREKSERSRSAALDEIRAEQAKTSAKYRRELSRCDFEMKKAVLSHRNALIEEFFATAQERLAEFTRAPKYAEYLKKAAANALETLGSDAVINARPQDAEAVRAVTKLDVKPDGSIIIGGISARNETKGLFADYTLDSRLRAEKAAFADKSELRL